MLSIFLFNVFATKTIKKVSYVVELTKFLEFGSEDEDFGGAIHLNTSSIVKISNSWFILCCAKSGGALGLEKCDASVNFCFFHKCSARFRNNNGGNAACAKDSNVSFLNNLFVECSYMKELSGDATVMLCSLNSIASTNNFTKNIGEEGQCSFRNDGNNVKGEISFMNVNLCEENDNLSGQSIYLSFANIINNTLYRELFYCSTIISHEFLVFNCYIFSNTNKIAYGVIFTNCFADFTEPGISVLDSYKTYSIHYPKYQLQISQRNALQRKHGIILSFLGYLYKY